MADPTQCEMVLDTPEGDQHPINFMLGAAKLGAQLYGFVQGTDGGIWCRWWDGVLWHDWAKFGQPSPTISLNSAAGKNGVACTNTNMWVFAIGSDGHLWTYFWGANAWLWFDLGAPPVTGSAPVLMNAISSPILGVYVLAGDGNIWCCEWNGASWDWVIQPALTAASFGGIAVPAFSWDYTSSSWSGKIQLDDDFSLPVQQTKTITTAVAFVIEQVSYSDPVTDMDISPCINRVCCKVMSWGG